MPISPEQLDLLYKWQDLREQLALITARESILREQLVQELFDPAKTEGSESVELYNEWKLKATKKLNYSLNNTDNQVAIVCASLPDVVSRSLVRWKPDLVLAAWRKIDAHTQELFKDVLEIKPAKPTLELIPPKE